MVICAVGICYAIYRDTRFLKYFPFDLRNRVAGAQLQKDGVVPYFYQWKEGDEQKYYDEKGDYHSEFGAITATPFFHCLLYPLVGLKQLTIYRVWITLQYFIFFGIALICYRVAVMDIQKKGVIVCGTLFLFTEAWLSSIASGQIYFLVPFLFSLFFFCFQGNKKYLFLAGLFFISSILLRPNSGFFFLPFLLFLKKASFHQIILFSIAPILFALFILSSEHQRSLWNMYKKNVFAHAVFHQNDDTAIQHVDHSNSFNNNDIHDVENEPIYSENGNFFVIFKKISGIKVSMDFLIFATLILNALLCAAFFKKDFHQESSLVIVCIFGACLYMISDLLSPIHRHQYYTVQWFFPLLIALALYEKKFRVIYYAIGLGLLLNIINTPLLKMEHTLGEYIWLLTLMILVFGYKSKKQIKPFNSFN